MLDGVCKYAGKVVNAEQAKKWGIVDEIVEPEKVSCLQ
jgi:enoyl-CoA hydratase/carnithine racemase